MTAAIYGCSNDKRVFDFVIEQPSAVRADKNSRLNELYAIQKQRELTPRELNEFWTLVDPHLEEDWTIHDGQWMRTGTRLPANPQK